MRTHTSQSRSSWKPTLSRAKSWNAPSTRQNPSPIQENTEFVAQQDITTSPEKPWGVMTGNVMKTLAAKESGSSQEMVIQPKLTIGEPGDKYEQEADRVAKQVVRQINTLNSEPKQSVGKTGSADKGIQMQSETDGTQIGAKLGVGTLRIKSKLQLQSFFGGGGKARPKIETSLNRAQSGGQFLPKNLQRSMGQAMRADFSRVRIHTDAQADSLNRSLFARAFTTGSDIFFKKGEYKPDNEKGQELIAHELTHVVQQHQGKIGEKIQRQITGINGPVIGNAVRDRLKLHQPVDITVNHDNPNPDRIEVKREARAMNTRRDLDGTVKVTFTTGAGLNQFSQGREYKGHETIALAKWQDDGPGEHNVTREANRILVHDAPGYSWIWDGDQPVTHHGQYLFKAKDLDDGSERSLPVFETNFSWRDNVLRTY